MKLNRLKEKMGNHSPERLAKLSKGDFSNMTVRRALSGMSIDSLKARAIAKALKVKVEELI